MSRGGRIGRLSGSFVLDVGGRDGEWVLLPDDSGGVSSG